MSKALNKYERQSLEEARFLGSPTVYIRGRDHCLVAVGEVWAHGDIYLGRAHVGETIYPYREYRTKRAADLAVRSEGRRVLRDG